MSLRTYANGALVEEWDDDARLYRAYIDGVRVQERAYDATETAALTRARRNINRAALEARIFEALASNTADAEQAATVLAAAVEIRDNPATTLTAAQIVATLKRLASGIAVLAEHDARTKRQMNTLIRLAVGALDSDT